MPLIARRSQSYRFDPAQDIQINWDSPQAQGLGWVWISSKSAQGDGKLLEFNRGKHGNLSGSVYKRDGILGLGVDYESGDSSDKVNFTDANWQIDKPAPNTHPSIFAWIQAESFPLDSVIVTKDKGTSSGSYDYLLGLRNPGGGHRLRTRLRDSGSTKTTVGSTVLSANKIYHAGFSVDPNSNDLDVYLNGIKDSDAGSTETMANSYVDRNDTAVVFGNNSANSRYLDGIIYEIRYYYHPLTKGQIFDLYNPLTRWDLYTDGRKKLTSGILAATKLADLMPFMGSGQM